MALKKTERTQMADIARWNRIENRWSSMQWKRLQETRTLRSLSVGRQWLRKTGSRVEPLYYRTGKGLPDRDPKHRRLMLELARHCGGLVIAGRSD